MGLHRAGFDVVGVDIRPQPRYPFEFHHADALTFPLDDFDFIWASPPCQAHTAMKTMHNAKDHEDLIPPTRARLVASGIPWAVENVMGAPLVNPIMLCGTMFGLGAGDAELRRHRLFETSDPILLVPQCQHGQRATRGVHGGHVRNRTIGVYGGHVRNRKRRTIGVYGEGCRDSRRKSDRGVADFSIEEGKRAMGIDWMTTAELSQAIPPAYAEFIGRAALQHLGREAA